MKTLFGNRIFLSYQDAEKFFGDFVNNDFFGRSRDSFDNYFLSTFHRSFPVPVGVDADQFKMEQEGKIILKFPKKKS